MQKEGCFKERPIVIQVGSERLNANFHFKFEKLQFLIEGLIGAEYEILS